MLPSTTHGNQRRTIAAARRFLTVHSRPIPATVPRTIRLIWVGRMKRTKVTGRSKYGARTVAK